MAGLASALFLTLLAAVTSARLDEPRLLVLLPLAGLAIGLVYHRFGGRSSQGNNLILDAVHGVQPTGRAPAGDERWLPRRMAPLVLLGTLLTHLFGGSAGREGTAIQMSGSLTDAGARLLRLGGDRRKILLISSIAGGFGAVFGVPIAGAVFALEVQTAGHLRRDSLFPALVAALVGDRVVHALAWPHDVTPRFTLAAIDLDPLLLAKVAAAALVFGLTSAVFSATVHTLKRVFARHVRWSPLRPLVGGLLVIVLTAVVGTRDYLGLSLPLIGDAYAGDVALYAFALKLLFTAITLGAGFLGGEVTPLFVIGATLGATMAHLLGAPADLLAAVGLVAVFAGATNTPIASTIMGVELFGGGALVHLFVGCVVAFVVSGEGGIYEAQRRAPMTA